jgi:hypothetical protein
MYHLNLSKIYPIWDLWYANIPSGNPARRNFYQMIITEELTAWLCPGRFY